MSNFETGAERAAQGANANISFTSISKPLAKKIKAKSKVTVSNIQPKLISLFSGGGGLDLGLEAAGFETIAGGTKSVGMRLSVEPEDKAHA